MVTQPPFAVFALAPVGAGKDPWALWAATTRAADRGESGRIGLPGGKVDPGETPVEALFREAAEEGWNLTEFGRREKARLVHRALVEGRMIHWYYVRSASLCPAGFKEAGRIQPISVPLATLANSGYGNEFLYRHWLFWSSL